MTSFLSLTFQGEPQIAGAIDPDDLTECRRLAFPLSPPRHATDDVAYRSHKLAPLRSGRLLVSVITNRNEQDAHGRPVLRATGCVLDREAMSGPARDPGAVWAALQAWTPGQPLDLLEPAIAAHSAWTSDDAYAALSQRLGETGPFAARVAAALSHGPANIAWGPGDDAVALLGPALALLPAQRLFQLELATAAMDGEPREAVLGIPGPLDAAPDRGAGLLAGLRGKRRSGPVSIDFATRTIAPDVDAGPLALVEAITDAPWSGVSARDRFRLLMSSMDATWLRGHAATPFELSPELEAMRRSVRKAEELTARLGGWR